MSPETPAGAVRPALIWGRDFIDGMAKPVDDIDLLKGWGQPAGFRWLHLNLADQRCQRWLATAPVPPQILELLLSTDGHQRAVMEDGVLGCLLQDVERDFDDGEVRIGTVHFALSPTLMITARLHPLRSADIVKGRLQDGFQVADAPAALELLLGSMSEVVRRIVREMDDTVQEVEDVLLKDGQAPDAKTFITLRSLMVRVHRMLTGMRAVLNRLDDDDMLPPDLLAPVTRAGRRLSALDSELLSIQSQLRLLREELDLQATQRTNQNLYILSILTATLMPATLVTGIFGMNTGGLPWASTHAGTLLATGLAFGSALGIYVLLRMKGFIRR